MPTTKRIDGDYTILSVSPSSGDNVNITTHTVNITGNLDVTGNVTYINVNDLTVDDPFITVAGNNSGAGNSATFTEQGLVAQTGASSYAGLRFSNAANTWQISSNVVANGAPIAAYQTIATSVLSPGGPTYSIQYKDAGNVFNGTFDFNIDAAAKKVTLNGHQIFGNIVIAPPPVANTVAVYHNAVGAGGTGLYVKSPAVEAELVSKSKAIVFALIF